MKDPCDDIRDWLYTTLNGHLGYGGSNVPVYSFPPKNLAKPYVIIGEHAAEMRTGAKDTYMWDIYTNIEIYTSFSYNNASYVMVNNISTQILRLLINRAGGTYGTEEGNDDLTNFKAVRIIPGSMATEREIAETEILITKTISINILAEEH